ncbi:MAG: hypothetical protein QOE20_2773, partial [Mycobacterium sp.]|nr:hypothetical protein [Mycobacterium sp.]
MPHRTLRRFATAIFAAGMVVGLAVSGPTAWADPEVNPDPGAINVPPAEQPAPPPEELPPPVDPMAMPPAPPADPLAPPPVDPLALAQPTVIPEGTPAGQNPTPYTGQPVFAPPTFNPLNGSMVGVGKPIYINFARPIANRQLAQDAVHISSVPPVPGKFYWA